MSRGPNQNVRLARAFRAAPGRKIDTLTMRTQLRIGNPGARIMDLEARGFRFTGADAHSEGTRVKVWRMVHDAGDRNAALSDKQLAVGTGVSPGPGSAQEQRDATRHGAHSGAESTEAGAELFDADDYRRSQRTYGNEEAA